MMLKGDIMKYAWILIALSIVLIGCTNETNTVPVSDNTNMPPTPPTPTDVDKEPTIIEKLTSQYQGRILAGNKTPYIEFNTYDYEKATTEGKVILLYFYSDLNPYCKTDETKIFKAFEDMENTKMIGFKVHYSDEVTTATENALAETLEVKNARTKIIIKDGKVLQRNVNSWNINDYAAQMSQYLD
jgi:thiol-disulfide isomerase/thioredoxin